jgi:hypothetical protein
VLVVPKSDRLGQQYHFLRRYLIVELDNRSRNNELCSLLFLRSYRYRNLDNEEQMAASVVKVDK